ncbi:NACHT, LRR and PYD domains-containing protein 3-like [Chanos chanos]|uniref:NACHT, LRR and PYD domains-containing protein 3-like n=1 Tax=Chanos chanos TaxID=29144 RepID=A0A6J2VXK3_CHACN|nr:NACHT, LRR and PYD domains-containing protein 3-like [Chanos chanos]
MEKDSVSKRSLSEGGGKEMASFVEGGTPPKRKRVGDSEDDVGRPERSQRPGSPAHSLLSRRSTHSMFKPPNLTAEADPPGLGSQPQRPVSPVPSCVSMASDQSIFKPPNFSAETRASDLMWSAGLTQDQSRCGLCQQALRDPVSTSCGHSFCRQCISTYWDQSDPLGDYVCPQCRKRSRTRPVLQQPKVSDSTSDDVVLRTIVGHKSIQKKKCEYLFEGNTLRGDQTPLNRIYTELYIIEGESEGVNEEHEVLQMETKSRTQSSQDISVNCNDIFKPLTTQEPREKSKGEEIRTVLTKGIAGIGKTVSVQKFILDWAEGTTNQHIDFMFALPLRELNLLKDRQYSLHGLLQEFYPELKDLDPKKFDDCQMLFVFDGLDESRLQLNFSEKLCDVTTSSSVNILISNLIQGNLLPSALVWTTSRPAAANKIPSHFISRVTEIVGFNDSQKEEYLRKRISDEIQANRIISHIKTSRSLHIMCHIPVFCWISATVLQEMLRQNCKMIPTTLTEMYVHFLLIQTKLKSQKYEDSVETDPQRLLEMNRTIFLKIAELAFKQLLGGNVMFYEEDLQKCGIDVRDATLFSGICTEIFKEEAVLYLRKKVYCFVHLSVQEFFAALYVFYCYINKNMEGLTDFLQDKARTWPLEHYVQLKNVPLHMLLNSAVDKALQSNNGHLDLLVRFLHGISLESNQKLLEGLLMYTESNPESIKKASRYIKGLEREIAHPERWINLLHCLTEMRDNSVHEEVHALLKSKKFTTELSLLHCTALVHMLLMSEEVLEELNLKKYNTSDEGRRRLVPAVRCCRKALLAGCQLTKQCCETVASVLKSENSPLIVLNVSDNDLQDSGVKMLSAGLENPHCKLEILRLAGCKLTVQSCEAVASVLQSVNCPLRELDLSNNDLQDSGVKLLCSGLKNPHCKLEILRLSGCLVTEEGCSSLASALSSNPSHLRELDLSYNHPGDSGTKLLSAKLEDPHCKLKALNLSHGGEFRITTRLRKYACELTLDPNTAHTHLSLSEGNRKVTWMREKQSYPDHPERFEVWPQILCGEALSGRCYWETEWSGDAVVIGVTYEGIRRKGANESCGLGRNDKSWNLHCSENVYSAWHNNHSTDIPAPISQSHRVGVYLDWPAGTLSFYSISSDTHTLTHIHTFHCTFTEPLCAGFRVWGAVSLC